jgi:glycosyltransferase involved in cell wall biosynthesis
LDALAVQTLADHEVIVVDDGSSDGAGEEAQEDTRQGRPVRLLSSGGAGAVAARRLGVTAARADLLAFTDSDCLPDPHWLAAGVAALESGLDVAQGATYPARPLKWPERSVCVTTEDGLYATCNVFYRRQAFDEAGGFDPTAATRLGFRPGSRLQGTGFGEDTLLGWRVRRKGRSGFVSTAVVRHHVFEIDLRESLRRAWSVGAFPALVGEVPELRQTLLWRRLFLERPSRVPLYAAGVAVAIRRPRLGWVSLGGWMLSRAIHVIRNESSWSRRVKVLPVDLALDGVAATALALGSVRATKPVL